MRLLACLLFAALTLSLPLSAAPDRYERQEAATWVKEEMNRLKKTQTLLKRVKDEKSAEKVGKALLDMYEVRREQTAMGEVGPAQKPTGEAMDSAQDRSAARFEKMEKAIVVQLERIKALELESATLASAIAEVEKAVVGCYTSDDSEDAGDAKP